MKPWASHQGLIRYSGAQSGEDEQGKKVKVTCQNGKVFEGDRIICTLPTLAPNRSNGCLACPPEMVMAMNELAIRPHQQERDALFATLWKDENYDLVTDRRPLFLSCYKEPGLIKRSSYFFSIGDKAPVVKRPTNNWKADIIN